MAKHALGFRVKLGWATAVVLSGPASSPTVVHVRRIELSDPAVPDSRQPYHAVDDAEGDWEPDEARIAERVEIVRRVTGQSVGTLLKDCDARRWTPASAGIVTGSLIDPSSIHQPHIRAHAMEGRLFRTSVEDVLRTHGLRCVVLGQKTAFRTASEAIHSREDALKRRLTDLGRPIHGPWRADEKFAALAAWVALSKDSNDLRSSE